LVSAEEPPQTGLQIVLNIFIFEINHFFLLMNHAADLSKLNY
jgi:hypothetical protein